MTQEQLKAKLMAIKLGKTGSREAAWAAHIIVICLLLFAMWKGPDMVMAISGIIITAYPATLGLLGYAYGLKHYRIKGTPPVDPE